MGRASATASSGVPSQRSDDRARRADAARSRDRRRSLTSLSSVWVATPLTAIAFFGLSRAGLLGSVPFPVLLALLAGAGITAEVTLQRCGDEPSDRRVQVAVALQILATTSIIYAIGWGPTLVIGYVFVVARCIDQVGSRAWRPAAWWTVVGIGLGQAAIAVGLVPSYVRSPYVHGLAALAALGTVFVVHLVGTKTADSERAQSELRASEASFRELFADNPQPMWLYDAETLQFVEVNSAATRHYGYTRDEFLGRRITDIRPRDDRERLAGELARRVDGHNSTTTHHSLKDGRVIDVEVRSTAFVFEGRDAVLVTVQDVTERVALEAQLRHQAFHDPLTNLANRALFLDRVGHALERQVRDPSGVAVLLLDLDGFKTVNDGLGHSVGDELLVAVADRLRAVLRASDTAARLGGDEFAVLLEQVESRDEALDIAGRMLDVFTAPFCVSHTEVFVRASIGIALGDDHVLVADDLVRNADAAMYRAKARGKGCVQMFEPAMHTAAVARLELENDLQRALDQGEFTLHYQPVVAIATGEVVTLEALLRWQHPVHGLVPPDRFIPVAEDNGLIVPIGRWVLREACAYAKQLRAGASRGAIGVAVNLSARQLGDPTLVRDVASVLHDTQLEPAALTLEITETVLIDDPAAAAARLAELKGLGVSIAIDDFGTGYSSLSSLQHLPVDTLKIDKAFIDDVTVGREAAGIVQTIVRLARTFHLSTVAEGVEEPTQLARLQRLGCDHVQGYCFSRPIPAAEVDRFLTEHALRREQHSDTAV